MDATQRLPQVLLAAKYCGVKDAGDMYNLTYNLTAISKTWRSGWGSFMIDTNKSAAPGDAAQHYLRIPRNKLQPKSAI
jgi:hypothetical protein